LLKIRGIDIRLYFGELCGTRRRFKSRFLPSAIILSATVSHRDGSDFLSPSRKSWTAVIVPSSVADDVANALNIFVGGVKGEFGASELHFIDIYSGRGKWKDVAVGKRIEIFGLTKV
jgi:hypothetical protein